MLLKLPTDFIGIFTVPLRTLSLGAGVQSSTLALMASIGAIEKPDCGIFADTKGEPASVYLWLSWLCGVEVKHDAKRCAYVDDGVYQGGVLTFPVFIVTKGSLEDSALAMKMTADGRKYSRTNIPFFTRNHDGSEGKIKARACTKDYKLTPIRNCQRMLVGPERLQEWRRRHRPALRALAEWLRVCRRIRRDNEKNHTKLPTPLRPTAQWDECQQDALVKTWIGISLDEVTRIKISRDPWCFNVYPLIDARMHRHDCLLWMKKQGYPKPPRSACVYCPFHNDDEWRHLRDEEPEEFARAVQFERDLQTAKANSQNFKTTPFLHRKLVPLDKVDFSTEEDRGQLNMFNSECEGMCGV